MTAPDYDVVIAGARCAGATLATFLARAGARVLLLDKDRMPSDHVLTTHGISPAGIDVLDEIGVGVALRAETPAARVVRVHVDGVVVDIDFPHGRAEYCPRRARVDGLLQQAAVAAGAEFRDRTRVTALIYDGDRVAGVRASCGDTEQTFSAGLVVGADGRHSTIASLVQAGEYLGYDAQRAAYWGYWNAPAFWTTDPAYRFDMYFSYFGSETGVIFPTDRGQLLLGSWPPAARAESWRADPERALCAVLQSEPIIGPLMAGARPDGPIRGTIRERFFFRNGAGPGWALVGDAGHHKDFVIGDGMTEALLQAKTLAAAIGAGRDEALTCWWRARDVAALPWYFFGKESGRSGPLPRLTRVLIARMREDSELRARMIEALDERVSPLHRVSAARVLWWTIAAGLRGQPQLFGELVATLARGAGMYREYRRRRWLLAEATASG